MSSTVRVVVQCPNPRHGDSMGKWPCPCCYGPTTEAPQNVASFMSAREQARLAREWLCDWANRRAAEAGYIEFDGAMLPSEFISAVFDAEVPHD